MLYYLLDIIPKIQSFSKKLDESVLLLNQHWVSISDIENSKLVFIFRPNEQLLVSENGKVERGKWEYIGSNSLIIERQSESLLFKHGFLDESVLALKLDGTDTYALFINESKYRKDINTIHDVVNFLQTKYLNQYFKNKNEHSNGIIGAFLEKVKLADGRELAFYATEENQSTVIEGCAVLMDGSTPGDDLYKAVNNRRFEISDGILYKEYFLQRFEQANGDIIEVDGHRMQSSKKGNRVWLQNSPAPDGQYKTGTFSSINVIDGRVV